MWAVLCWEINLQDTLSSGTKGYVTATEFPSILVGNLS